MLVVGSRALIAHGVRLGRKPMDIDIIGTPRDVAEFKENFKDCIKGMRQDGNGSKKVVFFTYNGPVEFDVASDANPTSKWLLEHYKGLNYAQAVKPLTFTSGGLEEKTMNFEHVHPDVVLALKLSHRYLKNSPHFRKTMDDILALRGLRYRVPSALEGWLKDRQKATLNYGHPSLERSSKKFFVTEGVGAVNYKYEHDDIHEALATLPHPEWYAMGTKGGWEQKVPAYTYFQRDNAEVSVDKSKWDALPTEVKRLSVLEESYVLALERSQIPTDFAIAPRSSFLIALEKVCTSITSGWWREYAWENYYQVLGMYSDDYVERFQKALDDGKIRLYGDKAKAA